MRALRRDDADLVLAFELDNRAWFARHVSDRGDEWFERFGAHFEADLADQAAGTCAFHLMLDDEGRVGGRFNLYGIEPGSARVGYRVAQRIAGRGRATAGLVELCRIAAREHAVHHLSAATSDLNVASTRVLLKAGFIAVGAADPADLGGKTGREYRRDLANE
ncbi:GNAT family N-acetyltransferase [Nocardioides sp. CBS4Y-1]|uniref:GNAT family N-acetyltransferase n=1 Tax=Nocardioides acrostichi TaxID=2784339 RepID=A0A930Y7G2_9ACTN|nr:GNAT family N-acetyltransferase [Nocardioides acrostichi]